MDTQMLLLALAGLLVVILIAFSLWSARREKSRQFSNELSTRPPSTPIQTQDYRQDVIDPFSATKKDLEKTISPVVAPINAQVSQEIADSINKISISLQDQPATQEHLSQPENPAPESQIQVSITPSQPEPILEPSSASALTEEPVQQVETVSEAPAPQPANIITLYVVAAEGYQFAGRQIVDNLQDLGFEFGEYQIFHRHLNNDSSHPVLFSAANMMQPGIFDLNTIDQFHTVGLVFFMHLPSVGNDITNLRTMLHSVERFAQAMGGFVLNDQQQLFDDQSRQDYLLRVSQQ